MSTIQVTEDPFAYRFSAPPSGPGGQVQPRATRVFWVSGTSDEAAARAAVDSITGFKMVQWGDAIAPGSPIVAEYPAIDKRPAFDLWVFKVEYAIPVSGLTDATLDPLSQVPIVQWTPKEQLLPVETDTANRPIVNAVGDRFSPPSRRVTYWGLTILRNEPFFNLGRAQAFSNRIATRDVLLGSGIVVAKDHMRCNLIAPNGAYKSRGALFVSIQYDFDLFLDDSAGTHPFDHPFLNAGRNGYFLDGSKKIHGPLVTDAASPVSVDTDIRFTLTGLPMSFYAAENQTVKVGDGTQGSKHDPIAAPHTPRFFATEEIKDDGGALIGYRVFYSGALGADLNDLGDILT